jgi:hypothetical protein
MADTPDYYKYLPNSVRLSLQDMGELAARMGSVVTYDRRGEVVWFDKFGSGLSPYRTFTIGGGGSVTMRVDRVSYGNYSCVLIANAGSSSGSGIKRGFSFTRNDVCGCEMSISPDTSNSKIRLTIKDYYNGSGKQFWVELDLLALTYGITLDGVTTTVLGSISNLVNAEQIFTLVKLVVDFENNKYVRLLIDRDEVDISQYSGSTFATVFPNSSQLLIQITNQASAFADTFIGHVIITANEP